MAVHRDKQYLKNIILMAVSQGSGMAIGLLLVPLTLGYLDATRYGLWVVISSTLGWIGIFDLGMANGLRNKLSEALAIKDFELAQKFISTAYFYLSLISASIILLFLIAGHFFDWAAFLNAPSQLADEFNRTMTLCFIFIALNFTLNIITIVLTADQKIGISQVVGPITSLLILLSILFLKAFVSSSFFLLCLAMIIPGVFVSIVMSIYQFAKNYRHIAPSWSKIRIAEGKSMMNLGYQFFFIQLAVIIVFAADNIVITKLFSPELVTPYSIAFKYMCIGWAIFNMILQPAWSAFTVADQQNDNEWIVNTIVRLFKLWVILVVVLILMVFISQPFFEIWIGSDIVISKTLTIYMAVFAALASFNGIFVMYLNGTGKMNLLMPAYMVYCVANIPLSIFYVKVCGMGTEGVMLGTISCMLIITIIAPVQTYFILTKKTAGRLM